MLTHNQQILIFFYFCCYECPMFFFFKNQIIVHKLNLWRMFWTFWAGLDLEIRMSWLELHYYVWGFLFFLLNLSTKVLSTNTSNIFFFNLWFCERGVVFFFTVHDYLKLPSFDFEVPFLNQNTGNSYFFFYNTLFRHQLDV